MLTSIDKRFNDEPEKSGESGRYIDEGILKDQNKNFLVRRFNYLKLILNLDIQESPLRFQVKGKTVRIKLQEKLEDDILNSYFSNWNKIRNKKKGIFKYCFLFYLIKFLFLQNDQRARIAMRKKMKSIKLVFLIAQKINH